MRNLLRQIWIVAYLFPITTGIAFSADDQQTQAQGVIGQLGAFVLGLLTLFLIWGVTFLPSLIGAFFAIKEYNRLTRQEELRQQEIGLLRKLGIPIGIFLGMTFFSVVWIKLVSIGLPEFPTIVSDTFQKFVNLAFQSLGLTGTGG